MRHKDLRLPPMPIHPSDIVELRSAAAAVIAGRGWQVDTWPGQAAIGKSLRSSALRARRGRVTVAVETPPPTTAIADVLALQRQYDKAGVRCLWLLAHPDFPISKELPAAFVDRRDSNDFVARLPGRGLASERRSAHRDTDWQQTISVERLVAAAFSGEFWYGTLREGRPATVRLDGEFTKCEGCGEWTNLCRAIEVLSPYPESHFAVYQVEQIPPHLLGELVPANLGSAKVGAIRMKYIREERRSRIVNSCVCCEAFQPPLQGFGQTAQLVPITQFDVVVSRRLATATALLPASRWRVSLPAGRGTLASG